MYAHTLSYQPKVKQWTKGQESTQYKIMPGVLGTTAEAASATHLSEWNEVMPKHSETLLPQALIRLTNAATHLPYGSGET